MIKAKKGTTVAVLYDSIAEPGETPSKWNSKFNREEHGRVFSKDITSRGGTEQWLGAPSREQFETRLRYGWAEGADRLRQLATKEINPTSVRRRRIRADQGDEVDMQAVWRGDLSRAWTRTRRMSRPGTRSVSIVCNLACNWREDAKNLFWRGAAALKLAEELTLAGYSVAIYGGSAVRECAVDDLNLAQFVEIKAEDAPLDVSALAALVAMPGFKRTRFHANTCAIADEEGTTVVSHLGYPDHDLVRKAVTMLPMPQSALVQPAVNSKEAAEKWIDEALAQIEAVEAA